jgi:aminoglycoside N3'-acetyltransferase
MRVRRRIFFVRAGMIVCVHGSLVSVVAMQVAVDKVVFAHTVH